MAEWCPGRKTQELYKILVWRSIRLSCPLDSTQRAPLRWDGAGRVRSRMLSRFFSVNYSARSCRLLRFDSRGTTHQIAASHQNSANTSFVIVAHTAYGALFPNYDDTVKRGSLRRNKRHDKYRYVFNAIGGMCARSFSLFLCGDASICIRNQRRSNKTKRVNSDAASIRNGVECVPTGRGSVEPAVRVVYIGFPGRKSIGWVKEGSIYPPGS